MKKASALCINTIITVVILVSAFMISLLFQNMFKVQEHITTLFVFAVFLISFLTDGYIYGIISAFVSMLAVNYAFTFPFFSLDFKNPINIISAVIMIIISILTGTLTTKIKYHEAIKAENRQERMRANLLRAVSHDLRTPLTTIYSSSSTLIESSNNLSNEQKKTIIEGIKEDSEWLLRMVENLLSITRIDSGMVKIIKTPTVLEELIDSAIIKFNKRYPKQHVNIEIPENIIVIPMDAMLIQQVIINILENAVQHATGMTTLSLKVFILGDKAVFQISDNGCGIEKEKIKTIFSGQYISEDKPADGNRHNTGIGLSVCATIIKAHGGDISACNAKKGGTVFCFSLFTDKEASDYE